MPEIQPSVLAGDGYHSIDPLPANNPAQAGPNCGLYALSYVMRHWYEKLQGTTDAIPRPLPARKVDVELTGKLPVGDPNKGLSLRYIAKHANSTHPMTFLGELFSGEALATVAQRSGFVTKIHTPATKSYLSTLFKLVDANHPAIVSLDVDSDIHTTNGRQVKGPNNGCPGKFGGEHAHWAVIVAYDKGFIWDDVVMFHWEKYFQFPAGDLRDSSNQLVRFSGQTWFKPKDPTEQVVYDSKTGNPVMIPDKSQPIDPGTGKYPLIPAPTGRGRHWQKLESENLPRNIKKSGTEAWNTQPGDYAKTTTGLAPPILSTNINGLVVKTVFENTNLNLRNVIIEIVPPGTAFIN